MFKLTLINMPFASLESPSLALTQLKSVVESKLGDRVEVDLLYLNQEFAINLGFDFYNFVVGAFDSQTSGLGEWFFRKAAFPEVPDNADKFFRRYFPYRTEKVESFKRSTLERREKLESFIDSLIDKHGLADSQIVGFTSMFTQNIASFAVAKRIKDRNPNVITIMGGANCETPMGQEIVKNVKQIDYVFSGPGLKSLPVFIEHCLSGNFDQCHSIKGVFSKKNYIFQSGPDAIGEELDIDSTVDLNYDPFMQLVERNFPNGEVKPILLFETSRGCWWGERAHCTFCGLNGLSMAYRSMKPELAVKQFESLFKYSPKISKYEAVDNILPRSYLQDVLPALNTPPETIIFYEVKADLSEQDMQVLAKARVKSIQPGIESLATSTLKLMKKGTTAFQNIALLKNCALYDIEPSWNLLVGFPGEGEEVYKKYIADLGLLSHLPPPTSVYPVRFDRYSPYFVKAKEYQLDLHPLDYYELAYPFDRKSISNMAYYFSDLNVGAPYSVMMLTWINKIREKVNLWVARANAKSSELPPRLYFVEKDGKKVVYDSRSGKAIEHHLGDLANKILEALDKPKRVIDITKEFGDIEGLNPEQELAALQSKGLIFQEGDKFISLVLKDKPSTDRA